MRRFLTLFPISAAEADHAADQIASLGDDWRTFFESIAVAGAVVIGLPALILFLVTMGDFQ